jgi:hypothetical protein
MCFYFTFLLLSFAFLECKNTEVGTQVAIWGHEVHLKMEARAQNDGREPKINKQISK